MRSSHWRLFVDVNDCDDQQTLALLTDWGSGVGNEHCYADHLNYKRSFYWHNSVWNSWISHRINIPIQPLIYSDLASPIDVEQVFEFVGVGDLEYIWNYYFVINIMFIIQNLTSLPSLSTAVIGSVAA